MKKVCVVTGSRAEYGLLKSTLKYIKLSKSLKLQLIVTGMHLSKKFSYTFKEIQKDGFNINHKIKMNLNYDDSFNIAKSMGKSLPEFVKSFSSLKPDLILILGDRYEIFAAATAAMLSRIPVAHLHGGEITEGAYDDMIRHSLTKMSHLHFVTHEMYKKRVIQLGEDPKKVFNVGGFGVDNIKNIKLLNKKNLEQKMNFKFLEKNLLITFHPTTLEKNSTTKYTKNLLNALNTCKNTGLIFTMPNADNENSIIFEMIKKFCKKNFAAKYFISLGQLKYFSCLKYIDAVVGNSSSGILEAPSFQIATINIGTRQNGRLQSKSIINVKPDTQFIKKAIKKIYSHNFKSELKSSLNPYGKGGAAKKVVNILEKIELNNILKKNFFNT